MRRGFLAVCVVGGLVASAGAGLAQGLQFSVTPENQPKDTASAETMLLYSKLNQRLADATDEPASSCLKSYAVYQGCKAGDRPKKCGKAPRCTAVAPLPPQIDLMGIRFNFPDGEDMAVLTPFVPRPAVDMSKIKMIREDSLPPAKPDSGGGGAAGGGAVAATPDSGGGGVSGGGVVTAIPIPAGLPKGPVRIAGGVVAGVRTSFVQPKYPPIAKIARLSGTVVLRAIISKTGKIENLEVSYATDPMFVMASIDAVRQWVYRPYVLNGEPTEVDTTVTVNFALSNPNTKPSAPVGSTQSVPQ